MVKIEYLLRLTAICLIFNAVRAVPVEDAKAEEVPSYLNVEYEKYLQEVVKTLESDPEFKKKLESANPEDIKSGKIAKDVDLLHHSVRRKLDELKRIELQRLEELVIQEQKMRNDPSFGRRRWRTHHNDGIDEFFKKLAHLDHKNPDSFEAKDLEKLIQVAVAELSKQDEVEKKQFKEYEMEKQRVYEQRLANMTEEQRKAATKEHEAVMEKRKEHPKIHQPGTKEQLEDVWENQDHLPKEEFDPKVFFLTHDLNGDGFWDENEMKALLKAEVDRAFEGKNPDEYERQHELEEMRRVLEEHIDTDKNRMISFHEFKEWTNKRDFREEVPYKTAEEKDVYTKEEYNRYIEKRKADEAKPHHEEDDSVNYYPYQPEMDPNFYPDLPPPPQYYQGQGPPGPGNYPPGGPQPTHYQHPSQQGQYQAQPPQQYQPPNQPYQQNAPPPPPAYNQQPQHQPPQYQQPGQPAYNQQPPPQHYNNPPPPPSPQNYNNPPPPQNYNNPPPPQNYNNPPPPSPHQQGAPVAHQQGNPNIHPGSMPAQPASTGTHTGNQPQH